METVTPRGACNQCQENRDRLLMAGKLVIHTKGVETCHGFQARKKKAKVVKNRERWSSSLVVLVHLQCVCMFYLVFKEAHWIFRIHSFLPCSNENVRAYGLTSANIVHTGLKFSQRKETLEIQSSSRSHKCIVLFVFQMTVFRVLFNHWKEFVTQRSKIPEGVHPREHFKELLSRHRADTKSKKEASERRRLARLSAERKKKEKEEREKKRIEDLARWANRSC